MKKTFLLFIFISILIAENSVDPFFQIFKYRNIGPTRGAVSYTHLTLPTKA